MKKLLLISSILILCLSSSCKKDEEIPEEDYVPTISLVAPEDHITVTNSYTYTFEVNASVKEGTISKVEYYLDDTYIGKEVNAPFHYIYDVPLGSHTLYAKAYANGNATKSNKATFLVYNCPSCKK